MFSHTNTEARRGGGETRVEREVSSKTREKTEQGGKTTNRSLGGKENCPTGNCVMVPTGPRQGGGKKSKTQKKNNRVARAPPYVTHTAPRIKKSEPPPVPFGEEYENARAARSNQINRKRLDGRSWAKTRKDGEIILARRNGNSVLGGHQSEETEKKEGKKKGEKPVPGKREEKRMYTGKEGKQHTSTH